MSEIEKILIQALGGYKFATGYGLAAKAVLDALDRAGYKIVKRGPDPLDEALNSGDGVYQP